MYFSFISQSSLVSDISMIASKNFLFAAGPAILDLQILNKLVGYFLGNYGRKQLLPCLNIFLAKKLYWQNCFLLQVSVKQSGVF